MTHPIGRRAFLQYGAAATGLTGLSLRRALAADVKGAAASPNVETTSGRIRGNFLNRAYVFKGVPYAASTAGAGRFMPPAKPQPWSGVKDTVEYMPRSPQVRAPGGGLIQEWAAMEWNGPMSEDCLSVNVYTAGLRDGRKRPVMLWLHGGGYANGSANWSVYDFTNLAVKHDVVVVGVNHRLNIFGYLYLADLNPRFAQASNAGQLDIIAALEWVRDNVANFGGDPKNVTIFGQSGGAGKVSTLLGMPGAKGLFHRAIVESGSATSGVTSADASAGAEALLKRLNIDKGRLEDLQKLPMDQLLAAMSAGGRGRGAGGGPPLRLSPVTDGKTLPAVPFDPVATPISADIPLMIGSTETETVWTMHDSFDPIDDATLHNRLKQNLRIDDAATDKIIALYRKSHPKAGNLDIFYIAGSDGSNFRMGPDLEADRKAALGKAPVYKYYFQWYSPVRGLRAMHTMELPFVFDNVEIAKVEVGSGADVQPLADKLSATWVAFAKTGNPNNKTIPHWPAYDLKQRATMILNNECKVVNDPYREEKDAIAAARGGRAPGEGAA